MGVYRVFDIIPSETNDILYDMVSCISVSEYLVVGVLYICICISCRISTNSKTCG